MIQAISRRPKQFYPGATNILCRRAAFAKLLRRKRRRKQGSLFMAEPEVENVQIDELKKGLADGTILLVDVREPNEYAAGRIPGAILNPLQHFDPTALPGAPGKRVVLSCRSGKRSLTALALAQEAGRDDIRAHYPGGFQEWANAGEKVEL
jgi:rhodanese-related sulfurtransferase